MPPVLEPALRSLCPHDKLFVSLQWDQGKIQKFQVNDTHDDNGVGRPAQKEDQEDDGDGLGEFHRFVSFPLRRTAALHLRTTTKLNCVASLSFLPLPSCLVGRTQSVTSQKLTLNDVSF